MASPFLDLPNELAITIIEQLEDPTALSRLALTCRRLQILSEPYLYQAIFYRSGSDAERILAAVEACPKRGAAIRSIEARLSWKGEPEAHRNLAGILERAPHIRELIIESPYCNNSRWRKLEAARARWGLVMERLFEPMASAAGLAIDISYELSSVPFAPLQELTTLTLHLSGAGREFWNVCGLPACIFAHPTLLNLHISSANLIVGATARIQDTMRTPLENMTIDECNITVEALNGILALPHGLKHLYLGETPLRGPLEIFANAITGENHYSPGEERYPPDQVYNDLSRRDPEPFLQALAQQQHSLQTFAYDPKAYAINGPLAPPHPETVGPGFSEFTRLHEVKIISPSYFLTSLFTSDRTSPPKLTELSIGGIESQEQLFGQRATETASTADDRNVSALFRNIVSAAPKLEELHFTFDAVVRSPNDDVQGHIAATGDYLKKRNIELQLFQDPNIRHCVRPILYGEVDEPAELIYANDGKGFLRRRQPPVSELSRSQATEYAMELQDMSESDWEDTEPDRSDSDEEAIDDVMDGFQE